MSALVPSLQRQTLAGSDALHGSFSRLSDDIESTEFGQQAFRAIKDRFVQRDIDHLPLIAEVSFL